MVTLCLEDGVYSFLFKFAWGWEQQSYIHKNLLLCMYVIFPVVSKLDSDAHEPVWSRPVIELGGCVITCTCLLRGSVVQWEGRWVWNLRTWVKILCVTLGVKHLYLSETSFVSWVSVTCQGSSGEFHYTISSVTATLWGCHGRHWLNSRSQSFYVRAI